MSAKSKIVVKQHWILLSKKFFFILPKPFCFGWLGFVCQITAVIAHCRISELQIRQKTSFFGFSGFFRAELCKNKLPEDSDDFYSGKRFRFSGVSPASRDQSFHEFDCFALKKVPNRLFRSRCISFLPALITGFARHESSRRKLFLSGAD